MKNPRLRALRAARLEEDATLQPDLARALRATVAFIGPLVLAVVAGNPHAAAFAAPAGLTLALTDLRGPYRERFAVALTMSLAMTGAMVLGVLVAHSLPLAVIAMGLVALLGGVWRHLSVDYGPGLTSATALLFLMALGVPGGWPAVEPLFGPMVLGCGLAVLLQMAAWFTRPQHPLRAAVADVWVATADLLLVLRPESNRESVSNDALAQQERTLRAVLDRAITTLAAAGDRHRSALLNHLVQLRQAASRLSAWGEAFQAALDPLRRIGGPASWPTVDSLLNALATLARAVAVAIVGHRPRHFAAVAVRAQRCLHLARVLDDKLAALPVADSLAAQQLRALLAQLMGALPAVRDELAETVDHAARAGSRLRRVPDLTALSPRSLTAWVDFTPQLDSVLVRHAIRMALLTMAAVAVYKYFDIERGYWIALTILVVLQPDYGATRKRAGQRILGTLAGAIVASGLLWIKLPAAVLLSLATLTAFCFAYLVRKNYRVAVFFVTIMLVLITESAMPVTIRLPLMRLGATLAGGTVALLAALFLWPSWERRRFPALLATALRANGTYLQAVAAQLIAGRALVGEAVLAKRAAETANAEAGASLEKMLAEPSGQHANVAQAGALTAYAQRLTRAITLLAVQLRPGEPQPARPLLDVVEGATAALDQLARAIEAEGPLTAPPVLLDITERLPDSTVGTSTAGPPTSFSLLIVPLSKAITEIRAMVLALDPSDDAEDLKPQTAAGDGPGASR
jgi:uncharacterized membrane protein YccC